MHLQIRYMYKQILGMVSMLIHNYTKSLAF